jgi:hypothetical protein
MCVDAGAYSAHKSEGGQLGKCPDLWIGRPARARGCVAIVRVKVRAEWRSDRRAI